MKRMQNFPELRGSMEQFGEQQKRVAWYAPLSACWEVKPEDYDV
jgi:hypothetical protein